MNEKSIITQLLYICSSSQLIITYFVLFYTLYNFNLYSFILLLILILKTLYLIPIKLLLKKTTLGKRPKNAYNCNQYNCGGVPDSGGFPSGHMLILGLLVLVILSKYTPDYETSTKYDKNRSKILFYITVVITTALGRYFTNCHTLFQIISGFIIGLIIGYLLHLLDILITSKVAIYKKHRDKFYQDLDRIFYNI